MRERELKHGKEKRALFASFNAKDANKKKRFTKNGQEKSKGYETQWIIENVKTLFRCAIVLL